MNLGRTRARGLELAAEAAPHGRLRVFAQYTYLDGEVKVSGDAFNPVYAAGRALLRRPKHQGSLTAAFGGDARQRRRHPRARRPPRGQRLPEHRPHRERGLRAPRPRARARIVPRLEAVVIAENVLDRRYQEVLGYPALGRSVRAGLRFRSGEARRP